MTQITQQIIHGNVTTISASGDNANISVNVSQGNRDTVVNALTAAGIDKADATELANILASEKAESKEEPFGKKAKAWIAKNIRKAADDTWKIGMAVATKVLTETALRYYGFK